MHRTKPVWLLVGFVLATGCWSSSGGDESGPTDREGTPRLDEVEIPVGFDFDTTRPISLDIQIDPVLLQGSDPIVVEVRRPSGGVIFRGTVPPGTTDATKHLSLPLPRHFDHVDVTVRSVGWSREAAVALSAEGQATWTFR